MNIPLETLHRIATALSCRLADLVADEDVPVTQWEDEVIGWALHGRVEYIEQLRNLIHKLEALAPPGGASAGGSS